METKKIKIDRENIFLKKSNFFGWGVVYPWKNEDGKINWFNFLTGGSWAKLALVVFIVCLILFVIFEYSNTIDTFTSCFDDPVKLKNCMRAFNPNSTINYLP